MRTTRVVATVMAVSVMWVVGGCSDDGGGAVEPAPSTTAALPITAPATAPTTAPATAPAGSSPTGSAPVGSPPPRCASGSSPSSYDPTGGTYAVRLRSLEGDAIGFDVVQWLTGADATAAWRRDHPEDPDGPPNDYYVLNDNPASYTATVAADAIVWLVRLQQDADADLDPGTVGELPAYLAASPQLGDGASSASVFWLTVDAGVVDRICEQYVP